MAYIYTAPFKGPKDAYICVSGQNSREKKKVIIQHRAGCNLAAGWSIAEAIYRHLQEKKILISTDSYSYIRMAMCWKKNTISWNEN